MLLTDSDIVTQADLVQIDSEVPAVASVTKPIILLEGPGSICEQTWAECKRKILAASQMYTTVWSSIGVSGGHQAAVNYTGGPARNMARVRLNQIVATESQYANTSSAVQLWMAYTALTLFFRDASARLGKDRLQDKYDRYTADAEFAWRQLRNDGLPWVSQPLEAPGAKHGIGAGTWTDSNLAKVAGAGSAQKLVVAVSYYDASRYVSEANTRNGESSLSAPAKIAMDAGTVLQVSIASLNPPNGVMSQVGVSQAPWTPLNATHWILWVGIEDGPLYKQAVLPIGTKTYTLPGDPATSGSVAGLGQWPDLMLTFQNIVGRG